MIVCRDERGQDGPGQRVGRRESVTKWDRVRGTWRDGTGLDGTGRNGMKWGGAKRDELLIFPFVSRIEFIRWKPSNFSAHISEVTVSRSSAAFHLVSRCVSNAGPGEM